MAKAKINSSTSKKSQSKQSKPKTSSRNEAKLDSSSRTVEQSKEPGNFLLGDKVRPAGFLLGLLCIIALFFLNLLISQDQLATFTLLCGCEILLVIVVSWLVFLHAQNEDEER